jgi:glyoxylase-like metal-dependent hydrolase (beta-lactamase superfamily II)
MNKIFPIDSGKFKLDGGAMFGIVPKVLWQNLNKPDRKNRITLSLRNLLIVTDDKKILIDTGIGTKYDEKFKQIYGISDENNLISSLEKVSVKPEEITDVVLSHLHFDHCGGTTYIKNNELNLTFPNAIHYVQKTQFETAMNPNVREKASFIKDNFLPVYNLGKMKLMDGNFSITNGVEVFVSNGHTKGMQLVKINADIGTVIYCADLIPTSSHIHLPYNMAYDTAPLVLIEEKKNLLEQAVKNDWILFFEHDPKFDMVKVKKDEKGNFCKKELNL